MILKKSLALLAVVLLVAAVATPGFAQMKKAPAERGKAELKTPEGNITIDYGRPSIKGQAVQGADPLSVPFPLPGDFWRMGNNAATVLTTPVDLTFGNVKVPKGSYTLWLHKTAADKFDLVFNSQTGQWGTSHDTSKDVYNVSLTKAAIPNSVELFLIELKEAPKGGVFEMSWGTSKFTTNFQFAK